jgi:hypothetical protein
MKEVSMRRKTVSAGTATIESFHEVIDSISGSLRIDETKLDRSIIEQPEMFHRVADALAHATDMRDLLKETVARVDSQVAEEVRQDFDREGRNYTKDVISDAVLTSRAHKDAYEDWQGAKVAASRLQALKEALEDRSRMLGLLVRLFATDYFGSSPEHTVDDNSTHRYNRQAIKQHLTKRSSG